MSSMFKELYFLKNIYFTRVYKKGITYIGINCVNEKNHVIFFFIEIREYRELCNNKFETPESYCYSNLDALYSIIIFWYCSDVLSICNGMVKNKLLEKKKSFICVK